MITNPVNFNKTGSYSFFDLKKKCTSKSDATEGSNHFEENLQ